MSGTTVFFHISIFNILESREHDKQFLNSVVTSISGIHFITLLVKPDYVTDEFQYLLHVSTTHCKTYCI